jgi:hypothetical protein
MWDFQPAIRIRLDGSTANPLLELDVAMTGVWPFDRGAKPLLPAGLDAFTSARRPAAADAGSPAEMAC